MMQFYMRMEAPTYRGSYLRYYGNVWGSLPLPDSDDSGLREDVAAKTQEIIDFVNNLETADEVLQNPRKVYESFNVETLSLTEHPAIKSFNLGGVEVEEPVVEENKITFHNLSAEIEFFDQYSEFQELVLEFLNVKTFEMADEIKKIELPEDESVLPEILERLQLIQDELEDAGTEMRELQEELDNLVMDLYDFDDEARELIRSRTEEPTNPLDTRVVLD